METPLNILEVRLTDISLGDLVSDQISGFEGIVTAEYYSKYNVRRLLVDSTTTNEDGNLIEPNWFDETSLNLLAKERVAGRAWACDHGHGYHFLDAVGDEVSGQRGKVLGWVYSLNGCTQIAFQPDGLDRDGNMRKSYDLHIGRLINYSLQDRLEAIPDAPKGSDPAGEEGTQKEEYKPSFKGCPRSSEH